MAKLSQRQIMVLEYIVRHGGTITAQTFADLLAGEPQSIRSMFAKGVIAGDAIPARNISVTDAGRAALTKATGGT